MDKVTEIQQTDVPEILFPSMFDTSFCSAAADIDLDSCGHLFTTPRS